MTVIPRSASERRIATLLLVAAALATPASAQPVFERHDWGIGLPVEGRRLEVRVCREDVFRVIEAPPGEFFGRDSLMTDGEPCRPTEWELQVGDDAVALTTATTTARVELATGALSFSDREGRPLLEEKRGGGRSFAPAVVMGESTFHVQAQFEPQEGEALYGLGQHQHGWLNVAGRDVDMFQHNIVTIVPFLVSSRGWGLLWDNTSHAKFGDIREPVHVPAERLYDADGRPGGLTGSYHRGDCDGPVVATRVDPGLAFGAPEDRPVISDVHNAAQATNADIHPALGDGPVCVVWEGELESEAAGPYDLSTFANNRVRVSFDGEPLLDTWRQAWIPWWDTFRLQLEEGRRYPIRVEWFKNEGEGTLRLKWKTPPRSPYTSLWSEVGDGIDYYFVYGPELEDVVAGYREITGRAPLMPRWALGFWQSRERYETAQESLDTMAELRERQIPVDTIVQDWQYWRFEEWGSHEFDPERFPDPAAWIQELHEKWHARLMISAWPKFYEGTDNFQAMRERGWLYPETLKRPTTDWLGQVHSFYDAFDPGARALFWKQLDERLFSLGVDAWWMDATEPELVGEGTPGALKAAMHPTALGSGARMANAFVLANSQGIYEGQRQAAPDQRVFTLTRSAFAGLQRYASASWSGDVSSDWDSLRKQIPAGLGLALSGIPWWTHDIGGFAQPPRWATRDPRPEDVEAWRELMTRWFQFGTFSPLTRAHGQFPRREMWYFGDESHPAYRTQLAFDRLRYRMLPYNYSVAANVTRRHGSILRPLVMDFREDPTVLDVTDQYLFGPSLLVCPVTSPGVDSRSVRLPKGADWYDFWTGQALAGGQVIDAPAPYESLPLYVRAGSILPMGPELQYTDEKPADPLTLWVYTGADASFELYEDDGVTNGYERGAFATIPMRWDEGSGTLSLGERTGSYPGMLEERTLRVVFVSSGNAVGHAPDPEGAIEIHYTGTGRVLQRD